jgi:predicted transposase YdaD
MHQYDTVLKSFLQNPRNSLLKDIAGVKISQWLNVELPQVSQTRVDLLGKTAFGKRLIGFELQSTNDNSLPLRMAEYSLRVYRKYGQFPEQYVLYVGNAKLRMPSQLSGPAFHCRYTIIDIRDIGEDKFLKSPHKTDFILAILAHHPDRTKSVRAILEKLAKLKGSARQKAFDELFILAGLRKLGKTVLEEVKRMPILDDLMTHDVIGPAMRKSRKEGLQQGLQQGLEQGLHKGLQEGLNKGLQEGELTILRRQIAKRFGPLPARLDKKLAKLPRPALEDLSLRLFDAKSIDDLFAR